MKTERIEFLLVEDNEHDILFIQRAWEKCCLPHRLLVMPGGESCLRFLRQRAANRKAGQAVPPLVVLLDDRMASKDGVEILREIRDEDDLCHLPVVMLMASNENYRKMKTYRMGANAYIVKPSGFDRLTTVVDLIARFWELAELPDAG